MGMYEYNREELAREGKSTVYLVTFLEHPDDKTRKTEMLIPEAFVSEDIAADRAAESRKDSGPDVHVDECSLSINPRDDSQEDNKIHTVLFRENTGDKREHLADIHHPEIYMSPDAASKRKEGVNKGEDHNMEANVYPLELYGDPSKFDVPRMLVQ